jgi:MFS family permease
MVRTPWLFATLLFASLMLLVFIGPLEVLVPFAIKNAGGGPTQHGYVLAAFGVGGAVGSLVVASLRLPRRYLTVMNLFWGLGCVPLVVFGFGADLWLMIAAGAVMGATFQAGMVIWGTLLQRRVPPALLGRVSSLDFFVSLSFMPLSMALAGTVSEVIGLTATFLVAGLAPPLLAVVAIVAARLPADELAHPLDVPAAAPARPAPEAEQQLDRV